MSRIRAGGEVFQAQEYLDDPLSAQPCLVRAKRAHGSALCQCVTPNRRLVIRSVNGVLFLTVWPNDGPMHDPGCEFFREHPFDAGDSSEHAGGVSRQARSRRSAAFINVDGVWDVNLDMQTRTGSTSDKSSAIPSVKHGDDRVASLVRNSLNMQQFLTWLWDSTSMVRWGFGWKRDWWRVARAIRTEAQAVSIHGRNMKTPTAKPEL